MRIALIGTRGVPARYGGFETAAEEIGRRLVERGHEVVVYCRYPGQTLTEFQGMELVNLPAVRKSAAETLSHTALSVGHAIVRDNPDVAFVFNAANAPFIPALRAARIPVAVHVDGLEWQRAKWGTVASAYFRWGESRSVRWADAVIADAVGIAEHLDEAYGVTARFIPYGAPIIAPDDHRLAELGVQSRKYHLIVARFEPENHVHMMVEGYVQSDCQHPLIVVGDAAYSLRYAAEVRATAGADPRVHFLGSVWDTELLDTLYAHCLTYVHGHSVGGTNPSLLRALGAGAPVVAYDVVFNREVAGQGGTYFQDPSDVAARCESAEANPADTILRGSAGQHDVAQRYKWSDVAELHESLAAELLQDGVSRRPRARGHVGSVRDQHGR